MEVKSMGERAPFLPRILKIQFLISVIASGLLGGCGTQAPSQHDFSDRPRSDAFQSEPTQYLVKYRPEMLQTFGHERLMQLQSMAGPLGDADRIRENLYRIQVSSAAQVGEILNQLQGSPDVEYVEPDWQVRTFMTPNDPQFDRQWSHEMVESEAAWDTGQGSHEVVVAVIDTGVDYRHEDLAANMWHNPDEIAGNGVDDDGNGLVDDIYGWDFKNNDNDPMADDSSKHGTHCAGIIGAVGNNSKGVIGQSPRVKIMALKFLGGDGSGSVSDAVKAIDYAISKNVQIMSNSWGSSYPSQTLDQAIERAREAKILFVAAAGNDSRNNDSSGSYPANYHTSTNMISVAATNSMDTMASFSNYGAKKVHVGAPGQDIYSTVNGGYASLSGTSMATPQVAGLAALIWAQRPDLEYWDIKAVIMDSVDRTPAMQGRTIANGRINARKAMQAVLTKEPGEEPNPGPVDPTPPGGSIARSPLLAGQTVLQLNNPYAQIPITYDLSEFVSQGQAIGYVEVSRPNTPFQNPNGSTPDPYALTWAARAGPQAQMFLIPIQHLPSWGTYFIRVIPLNQQMQPVGSFSDASQLILSP